MTNISAFASESVSESACFCHRLCLWHMVSRRARIRPSGLDRHRHRRRHTVHAHLAAAAAVAKHSDKPVVGASGSVSAASDSSTDTDSGLSAHTVHAHSDTAAIAAPAFAVAKHSGKLVVGVSGRVSAVTDSSTATDSGLSSRCALAPSGRGHHRRRRCRQHVIRQECRRCVGGVSRLALLPRQLPLHLPRPQPFGDAPRMLTRAMPCNCTVYMNYSDASIFVRNKSSTTRRHAVLQPVQTHPC